MTSFADARAAVLADLVERDAVRRLFDADHTLWRDDPTELADRLGWIPVVGEVLADLPQPRRAVRCARRRHRRRDRDGDGRVEPVPRGARPHVRTGPGPAAAARARHHRPRRRSPGSPTRARRRGTLHLASSKSGSTIETRSHLEWAWERAAGAGRFAVITDPGSELGTLARERGFADVFENRSDIGGRYSALSLFGVVPGLLMGADVAALLQGGLDALGHSGPTVDAQDNPALQLACHAGRRRAQRS